MAEPIKGLKRYDPALEEDIFAFQQVAYPQRDPALIPARWRWMFLDSAARHGCEPLVWLYWRKGELVAHQGAIPVRCKLGGQVRLTSWFVETMVLEHVRGGPVGAALVAKALEDEPFNLSLGQSPVMRELQYRLGWKKIGALHTYVHAIDGAAVMAQRGVATSALAGLGLKAWNGLNRLRLPRAAGLAVAQPERFGTAHDGLWARVAPHYPCAVCRDAAFLNWKFVEQPGQPFERWQVIDGDVVRAVAVTRRLLPAAPYHYPRWEICELVVAPDDGAALHTLLAGIITAARAAGAALVSVHLRHAALEAGLRAHGFLRREATRWLLLATAPLAPAERELAEREESWLLTGSDSDIDRP